ncbi:MAG TPA: hypothetical protein VGC94_10660 [Amnibacterium sp.]
MSVRIALGGAAEEAVGRVLPRLVDEKVASGITAQDASLWGAAAETDAAGGLGWTESVAAGRDLVAPITRLRRDLRRAGAHRVLLLAPLGAARAAAMIAGTQGVDLTVLTPGDPAAVQAALRDAADTVVVVAGTDAGVLAPVVATVHDLGVDPARRVVVVARAGSPLDAEARAAGLTTVPWERGVGDRFSALSAPALVAAGLAGADLAELLDEAESEELNLAIDDRANNGLRLGAALGGSRPAAVAVVTDGTHLVGGDRWAAHLLAGAGLEPRALRRDAPELADASAALQVLRLVDDAHAPARIAPHEIRLSGSLGELILALEYTAAVAAWLRGADPFSEESV